MLADNFSTDILKKDMMVFVAPSYYYYETVCRYLNLQDMGQILGIGCGKSS